MHLFSWDANPMVDPRLCKQSVARAEAIVTEGRGKFVTLHDGRRAVQYFPPPEVLMERSAKNNLIPFGRVLNRLMAPPSINYPIPACGARNRVLHVAEVNALA